MALSGCTTSQEELLPTNGNTMDRIWQDATTGSGMPDNADDDDGDGDHTTRVQRARSALRRPIAPDNPTAARRAYTRTATNEIHSQFSRLPNPDLTLYIFPHLSGGSSEQVPVPGYTTIFPLYDRPHYGQPGEQTEYQPVTNTGGAAR
jgi:conjugative transfer region lipoprotein (TIGR03751 family)